MDEAITWEPVLNVKGCGELVEAFHKEHPGKPNLPKTIPKRH